MPLVLKFMMFYHKFFYKKLRLERIFVHEQQIFRPLNVPPFTDKSTMVFKEFVLIKLLLVTFLMVSKQTYERIWHMRNTRRHKSCKISYIKVINHFLLQSSIQKFYEISWRSEISINVPKNFTFDYKGFSKYLISLFLFFVWKQL